MIAYIKRDKGNCKSIEIYIATEVEKIVYVLNKRALLKQHNTSLLINNI